MNRRNFLSLAALAIAGKAAERVWPFRVYSIPKEIVVAKWDQSLMTPPSSFEIPSEFVKAMRLHVYSADLKVHRGSFLATVKDCTVLGMIPEGITVGDVLVPEVKAPSRRVDDILAHAFHPNIDPDKRTGIFLNLARS
jgi:hypothetical protein